MWELAIVKKVLQHALTVIEGSPIPGENQTGLPFKNHYYYTS